MNLPWVDSPWKELAMQQRFEVRKEQLLAECQVQPEVFEDMMNRLWDFSRPFADCLHRREQKEHAQVYLSGLLSDLSRKNVESIAYRHDQDRQGLQRFIGMSSWDHEPLMAELVRQVGLEIGRPDGVIVFDPSGFAKMGSDSVGVARQWIGRVGKVAVYMGYASQVEHALVDMRLYLPKEWAQDPARRKACGVPKEIRFQTRHELALEMLAHRGGSLPHAWIAGDDEMGRSTRFRRDLQALDERCLLAVPLNTLVRDLQAEPPAYGGRGRLPKQPFRRVDQWRDALPEEAWSRIDVRDGEKGPLIVEAAKTRVQARTQRGRGQTTQEVLFVTRTRSEDGKTQHDCYLSNAPFETSLEEFARVAKAEHRIEECIQRGKGEAGLGDYEVRTWVGWHHHQTLSLIATWFLICESRRGKKMDAGDHGSADSRRAGHAPPRSVSLRRPPADCTRTTATFGAERGGATLSLETAQPIGPATR
jgi:SRSO17 transposase